MITLDTLFKNLAYGELANIGIGDAKDGIIPVEKYDRVLSHVKLGLTDLHSRFRLRTGEVLLQTYSPIERYYLRPECAVSNATHEGYLAGHIYYIEDNYDHAGGAEDTFQDNVLKIEKVYDEELNEYRINDTSAKLPMYTPEPDCLAITYRWDTPRYYVIYRADHAKLPDTVGDPKKIDLQIPNFLVSPLQQFVAYSLLSGMGAGNAEKQMGTSFFTRYEFLCKQITNNNLDPDDNETYNKLEVQGWV